MRATLLTAQKMADSIVHEAEAKRDEMLSRAESDARARIQQLRQETEEAQERLRQGQLELAKFIASVREVCARELTQLEQLPELPVETARPDPAEEPAAQIEETVMASFAVPAEEPAEAPAAEETPAEPAPAYPEGDPFARESAPEVEEPTRRINLSDLKFGRNYKGER